MTDLTRRRVLGAISGVLAGGTGCLGGAPTREDQPRTSTSTPDAGTETGLVGWERSTDCVTAGERDGMDEMYDSVIAVDRVEGSLGGGYSVVEFADLTAGEREILRTVTEEGGYATCNPSESFERFLTRVWEHKDRQDETMVYLRRNGTYYGLYVESTDQGVSY